MNADRHPEHTITVEFIGTDIAEMESLRNRYTVTCSCKRMGGSGVSRGMQATDRKVTEHLAKVGLNKN